jgi:tritrans,polycis-undecaprenyl-diphosphate synthase [geranylgeranyl-diphosphate specific]
MFSSKIGNAKRKDISLPKHVGLIPDGNRRWARTHRLNLEQAYDLGIKKFINFSEWLVDMGVNTLTAWALSYENVSNRSKSELNTLYSLYIKAVDDPEVINLLKKNRVHVNIIGDLSLIPKKTRDALHKLETLTAMYRDRTMNLLVAYGGREDLEYAMKRIAAKSAAGGRRMRIDYDEIRKNLLTSAVTDVDMIIRTSGEKRTSGFLPWQSTYAELYFARKYWPEFSKRDLKRAIDAFSRRQRRFGK